MSVFAEIIEGPGAGKHLALEGSILVGREPSADITIDEADISRQHARMGASGERAWVEDLNSRNGTYVNGQISPGRRELQPGDEVRIGLTVLKIRTAADREAAPSAIRARPALSQVGPNVLRPVPQEQLPPVPAGLPGPVSPLRTEENEPAFISLSGVRAGTGNDAEELARLVDGRVKRQTNTAAIALLAFVALLVVLYFGT